MADSEVDSEAEEIVIAAVAATMACVVQKRRKRRCSKSIWMRDWLTKRPKFGAFHALMKDLREGDPVAYRNFVRLSSDDFDELLQLVDQMIAQQHTKFLQAHMV